MTIASEIANNNNLIVAVGNWARTRGIDRNRFHIFAIHYFERIAMLLVVNANEADNLCPFHLAKNQNLIQNYWKRSRKQPGNITMNTNKL